MIARQRQSPMKNLEVKFSLSELGDFVGKNPVSCDYGKSIGKQAFSKNFVWGGGSKNFGHLVRKTCDRNGVRTRELIRD